MADDTLITGTTVGDDSYIVAYYDVNTGNLYNANGTLFGNNILATTLDNTFTFELHYVQDISTSNNPEEWTVWNGLDGKKVSSTLAYDNDFKHAVKGTASAAVTGSTALTVVVPDINADTMNQSGVLVINPFGNESTRQEVSYSSFTVSGTTFTFVLDSSLTSAVDENAEVRVSDPMYLSISSSSIYESNIPDRYSEGVFKFPMNIISRKLLKALDYTNISGVSGTLEHKIYINNYTLSGIEVSGKQYTRNQSNDTVAIDSSDNTASVFCSWSSSSSNYWTKGNSVAEGTPLYNVTSGTASLAGITALPIYDSEPVLFRTFAFPFVVKNLIGFDTSITIPVEEIDWTKEYIINILKNNINTSGGSIYVFGSEFDVSPSFYVSLNVVPFSKITGLTAGYRIEDISGGTIAQKRVFDITTVGSGTNSIIMQPGEAYKITAVSSAFTLNTASIPSNKYGLESHLEIFVAGNGYIHTGDNVYLANALEPDAVNNCTVRFHDGKAIISVEDYIAGRVVTVNAPSGTNTLNYWLSQANVGGDISTQYITFDASLNGQTLDMNNAVTNGEKHIVGNGYTETIISGGINCTSKTTLSNLAADGVVVSSGTLTLGDAFIPSGSTVAVSGGGLAIEKVTGNGGTVDLGGVRDSDISFNGTSGNISGCTVYNGNVANHGGGIYVAFGTVHASGVAISGCTAGGRGGGICVRTGGTAYLDGCTFTDNSAAAGNGILVDTSGTAYLKDCTFNANQTAIVWGTGVINLEGTNKTASVINNGTDTNGKIVVSSGAVIDLTDNDNPTPISAGLGITFEAGGATVYPSAGSASAVMIGGCTAATISNGGVVTISNGMIPNVASGASLSFTSVPFVADTVGRTVSLTNCTVTTSDAIRITSYSNVTGTLEVYGTNTFGSILSYGNNGTPILVMHDNSTISFNGVSTTYDKLVNCTIGQIVIGTNCSIVLTNGTTVPLTAGTYTSAYIAADGTITEA